jgi:GNAT superfamily N-acetyltransferase
MVEVRKSRDSDYQYIAKIFSESTGRETNISVADYMKKYPSVVADQGGEIVGFCYSKSFAPDIIELMNIYIKEPHRGKGLGKRLISEFEKICFDRFSSIILINSTLYPSKEEKRLATNFYKDCGYKEIMSTPSSKVYCKSRQDHI